MLKKHKEISGLLWCLLFFSAMVGAAYKLKAEQLSPPVYTGLASKSVSQIIGYLQPLIASRSVEALVYSLRNFPADKALQVIMGAAARRDLDVKKYDVIEFTAGVALHYARNKMQQEPFFDYLITIEQTDQGEPVLYVVARSSYAAVIPALLERAKQQNKYDQMVTRAVEYAIKHKKYDVLQTLDRQGNVFTKQAATALLMYGVQVGSGSQIVQFLIAKNADVNAVDSGGYTPLIYAAQGNHAALAQLLLDAGAQVDKIANDAVGSALQVALKARSVDVEMVLRKHGARE